MDSVCPCDDHNSYPTFLYSIDQCDNVANLEMGEVIHAYGAYPFFSSLLQLVHLIFLTFVSNVSIL